MAERRCTTCGTHSTKKWYSGPTCLRCYKSSRYQENKQSKRAYNQRYYSLNKAAALLAASRRYATNRRDVLLKVKARYSDNKEAILAKQKKYYKENKIAVIARNELWRKANWTRVKIVRNKRIREREKEDVVFMLRRRLRSRIYQAVRNSYCSGLAIKQLGCSVEQFKKHVEGLFQPEMSWMNYGREWELDHKIPLSRFDLTNEEELLSSCHFTNYQPLWKAEHYRKSANDVKSRRK